MGPKTTEYGMTSDLVDEAVNIDGVVCGYEAASGDAGDDGSRLRIIDVPAACTCSACEADEQGEDSSDDAGFTMAEA